MAILKGPLQFNGSVGRFRSYKDGDTGEQILSTKGGLTKEQIKNNLGMWRTRAMNEEFKACNIFSEMIRRGTEEMSPMKKGRITGKLVKIGEVIQKMGGMMDYGFRKIESSKFNFLLSGFCMNNAHPFKNVCNVDPEISIGADRREVVIKLTDFVSHSRFQWDERVYYYRVYLNIQELPDIEWNENMKQFSPVYPVKSLGMKTSVSEWIPVSIDPINFMLSAAFDENFLPREKTTVVVSLGFEFASGMQYNTPYVVKGNGTMAIVGCY